MNVYHYKMVSDWLHADMSQEDLKAKSFQDNLNQLDNKLVNTGGLDKKDLVNKVSIKTKEELQKAVTKPSSYSNPTYRRTEYTSNTCAELEKTKSSLVNCQSTVSKLKKELEALGSSKKINDNEYISRIKSLEGSVSKLVEENKELEERLKQCLSSKSTDPDALNKCESDKEDLVKKVTDLEGQIKGLKDKPSVSIVSAPSNLSSGGAGGSSSSNKKPKEAKSYFLPLLVISAGLGTFLFNQK